MDAPEIFFREWRARRPDERRDLGRARLLAESLNVTAPDRPVLTIVGSKGKGTTATYASACLASAGLRVVAVTSPAYRSVRERIRLDGAAVSPGEFAGLTARLESAIGTLPRPVAGYLSPTGLFTLAGVLHAHDAGADAIVLEAGIGGGSDEVSLFPAAVVAISRVFAEHVGIIGDTPAEIAAEKAAVVAEATDAVLSLPQSPAVEQAITATVRARSGAELTYITDGCTGLPSGLLPRGFSALNAELGVSAARRLHPGPLPPVFPRISLPGRLSWHRIGGTELLVDSAISGPGVVAALAEARGRWPRIDRVLVCLPDHKDLPGAIGALDGLPVTFVRLPESYLRFTRTLPPAWNVIDLDDLDLGSLGSRVVAMGTVHFTGHILDLVDADTDPLFTVLAQD